jgi:hypothetical protein
MHAASASTHYAHVSRCDAHCRTVRASVEHDAIQAAAADATLREKDHLADSKLGAALALSRKM